jgi:Xaa-Pro dipeptidase
MSDSQLYRQHLEILDRDLQKALDAAGRKGLPLRGVLFHAGSETPYHADDNMIAFRATPHFLRWVPLQSPDHLVLARPGRKPTVVRVRPKDYWYDTSPPPTSYWEEEVELLEVESLDDGLKALGSLDGIAYVGSSPAAAAKAGISEDRVEPPALLAPLDWYRATKTPHEAAQLRLAARRAAAGHHAAREAFEAQATEQEIHWAFLRATGQMGTEVPYGTIVALDDKAAILHYQHKRGAETGPGSILLIDAGAGHEGQAADITRTWARPDTDPAMVQLLHGLDALERDLVALVTPGRPYLEIHLEAHRRIGDLLAEVGVVRGSGAAALERGIVGVFMPHGVGHHLGLQVHDVGGFQAGPEGGRVPPPEEHPFLRNTRILEPGHSVTIEPGIYFIPMLLEPLRASAAGSLIDWPLVDRLTPLGGLRIEDDILCTEGAPRDLTRDLIAGPRGV